MKRMNMSRALACVLLTLGLAACAPITVKQVATGEQMVGQRLKVTLEGAWNNIESASLSAPNEQIWTLDGLPLDQLLVYTGVNNGERLHGNVDARQKVFTFRSDMGPDQIVAQFEGMLTRDGSSFSLRSLAPAQFAGVKGFRFEYTLVRKEDNVELHGVGGGAIDHGQLYAIVYQAPKLMFKADRQQRIARILDTAVLKG